MTQDPTRGPDLPEHVYAPPKVDDQLPSAGRNPIHTGVFATLFVVMVLGAPLLVGGFVGLLMAPVIGAALWGLYLLTLPRGPKLPSVNETAGVQSCPACGSVQTDRRPVAAPDELVWECFACDHRW